MKEFIRELVWDCHDCGKRDILGREVRCPSCGSSRGEKELQGARSQGNSAPPVTDPELLKIANGGADWFCPYCNSGNRRANGSCASCGGQEEEKPPKAATRQEPARKPVASWEENIHEGRRGRPFTKTLLAAAFALTAVGVGIYAFISHEVEGRVSAMHWNHTLTVKRWTPEIARRWKKDTKEVAARAPVNGSGGVIGMHLIGNCRDEQSGTERYVSGHHEVCTPQYRTKTESYPCGTSCTSSGNGFERCRPKTCTRTTKVSAGMKCESVPDYSSRPVYSEKCDYETQRWDTMSSHTASGTGHDTDWPKMTAGVNEALYYNATYQTEFTYSDEKDPKSYTLIEQKLDCGSASSAEAVGAQYKTWDVGEEAILTVRNMGSVVEVKHLPDIEK